MTWMFVADGECLVISPEQWQLLDAALDVNDVDRARVLWDSWRPPSWPATPPHAEPTATAT
jgi:hypothetical protein